MPTRTDTLTEDLIDSYLHPKTVSRNAQLALLKYFAEKAVSQDPLEKADGQENLFSGCIGYFSDYCVKTVCFHDLRPYVSCLSRRRQEKFLILIARECRSHRPKSKDPDVSHVYLI